MATVLKFTIKDFLELEVTAKKTDGRLMRHLKRVGKLDKREDALVEYSSSLPGNWSLENEIDPAHPHEGSDHFKDLPVFFESRYFVRCDFLKEGISDVNVVHPMASIADAFSYSKKTLIGSLDFVNSPGKFRLLIEYKDGEDQKRFVLEWMVVSEKMDVAGDLAEITKTIKEASPNLVHAFLAKTFTKAGVTVRDGCQDDNVWYALFRSVYEEYRESIELIVNRPHLKYVPHEQYLRADRIKRWTPQLANRYWQMDPSRRNSALFRSEQIDPEIDTVENRFVLFTLNALQNRLGDFAEDCRSHDSVSSDYVDKMIEKKDELAGLAAKPFFKGVGRFQGFRQESLALQRKPGYSRIYSSWIILQQSLGPYDNTDGIDIGYRPISALYEYWCFLIIRNKIADSAEFHADLKELTPTVGNLESIGGLFDDPDERKPNDRLNKLEYEFSEVTGTKTRKLRLVYQQSYGTGAADGTFVYLNPQRPDIVLTIVDTAKTAGEAEYSYIFDAKYRIAPKLQEDAVDETTSDAINAMHQYRDAILYRKQNGDKHLSREIIGAYVLYPGRPDPNSFKYDPIIAAENIGAIPLLPAKWDDAAKDYVRDENGHHGEEKLDEFLKKILKLSTAQEHLGVDADGHARVIATRGTTNIVGKGFGEDDIWTQEVPANVWACIESKHCVVVSVDEMVRAQRDVDSIRYIRVKCPNHTDIIVKVKRKGDTEPQSGHQHCIFQRVPNDWMNKDDLYWSFDVEYTEPSIG